jgi:hypothetical protein
MATNSVGHKTYPTGMVGVDNGKGPIHHIKAFIYGECPKCNSTHSIQIKGWAKRQCSDCGCTWNY